MSGNDAGSDGNTGQSKDVSLTIGDKTYGVADVQALIEKANAATTVHQQAKPFLDAAGKYNLDPEDYLANAEGALAIASRLLDEGIINDKGELVQRKAVPAQKSVDDPLDFLKQDGFDDTGKSKTSKIVLDALQNIESKFTDKLGSFEEEAKKLKSENAQMFRLMTEMRMKSEYPDLESREISQIIGRAATDKHRRGLGHHVEEYRKEKGENEKALRERYAKEFGINLEEYDENQLRQQNAEGGAAAIFKGKKISFNKGENTVNPTDAADALIQLRLGKK